MTVNKLRTLYVETDGSTRPSDSVPTTPKHSKIKHKMCDETFSSVRDLNLHHRQDHGVVKYLKCDKYFSTQSSLDKHSYSHGELKYNCKLCGKCFPFQSRLDQHMMVHINNKLSCPKKSCDRQFKSIWDLNQHMNSHTKGGKEGGIIVIIVITKTKTNRILIHICELTALKRRIVMNVTSAVRRCTLVLNINVTGSKVVMFSPKNSLHVETT